MSEHTEDLFAPPAANHQEQEAITLGLYAERAYLDYAISVVKGRALPDVSDGQKPVQRRILYAMYRMGLSAGAKPVKSARVVGDVLGKYHPHGDTAAYDAMVRMAQNFSLRYPLIDGQGNFGSRDGDGAAAMRYTEARLTAIAQLLLEEIDQGTVDYIPNYDGSELEPQKLPARLPMALLNGASGIAVGMATEIPAHNLTEVARAAMALLQQPELSDAALLQLLPGPDFAGGGQIITPAADIAQMYTTGKGSLKVRARWTFEEMARGQWQLVVTELPPAASGQKILEEIEELTNPKVKVGKKTLTTEQQQTKALLLSALDTVRDESGKDAQVRLVFEPKTAKIDRQEFVRLLLAHTSMESNVAVNLVMIGNDGRPQQKSLRQILSEWVDYRRATVVRRIQHRLEKVFDRLHVLEGRLIVFLNIDEVIRIIRESDEPKPALISAYRLSERQADDILEIRLRQLARLERIKIEQEMSDLRAEADTLQHTLDHPDALQGCLLQEMQSDSQRFGDARRTLIQEDERTVLEVKVVDEPMTVIVSEKGWLRARQGHAIDTQALHFKTGDSLFGTFECRTTDHLIACANNGRVYSIPTSSIPFGRGDGQPITTMIDLEPGTRIVQYIAGAPDTTVIFANNQGRGFYSTLKDLVTRQKAGKQFITLSPEEQLLPLTVLPPDAYYIACITLDSKALLLEKSELKYLASGGKGNILCGLHPKDSLQQVLVVGAQGLEAVGVQRGKEQLWSMTLEQLLPYVNKAARKGKPMTVPFKQPVWRTRL